MGLSIDHVFQLNVVKGYEICFCFSLAFNMRLGRLHTDTSDQYWGLTDLNSSQEYCFLMDGTLYIFSHPVHTNPLNHKPFCPDLIPGVYGFLHQQRVAR